MTAETSSATQPGLTEELAACWRRLPDKGLFFALLGIWCALFHWLGNSTFGYVDSGSLFLWLNNAYNATNSDDGHGNLIPIVVLVLFWLKREELLALTKNVWWPALGLVVLALLLHVIGYTVQQPRISVVALFIGIYGMMGLVWGWRFLRHSFFPFCLFVFCVPAGSLAEAITFPLRILVAKISVAITNVGLGIDVVRDGSRIFDSQHKFNYDVAPACSGVRSLVSLLALTTIYGVVTFKSLGRRWLMVGLAVPLAILGNVIRLVVVILVANAFGEQKGLMIEQKLGFLTFAVAITSLLIIGHLVREKPGNAGKETA